MTNLGSLLISISNSVVAVGLYYGFLSAVAIGPSYILLFKAQALEEGQDGIVKKVAATTGFIMGQLIMFISIYYTPLHLALGRPHTITVLVVPYLFCHFFSNNHKSFLDFNYDSTSRNSIRNLSIQCVFMSNLIFQLFNHFILPSSTLARLVTIYMFRCNNKIFFLTSSFFGWLVGHILVMKGVWLGFVWLEQNQSFRSKVVRYRKKIVREFLLVAWYEAFGAWIQQNHFLTLRSKIMQYKKYPVNKTYIVKEFLSMKWVGLVFVWIEQNHSLRPTRYNYNKYYWEEFKYSMSRFFSILFFITCLYYLGRMPSPIFSKKLIESEETFKRQDEETKESEDEETKEEGFTEEVPSLFSEEKEDADKDEFDLHLLHLKEAYSQNSPTSYSGNQNISKLEILKEEDKSILWFDRPTSLLFDYNRWNRPTRYIKNNRFENAVRNEASQYFFDTCQNDGKKRISFTYPPSLSIFWEMLQRKISLSTPEKLLYDELYNYWIYTNEQNKKSLRNELTNRIAVLDKGLFYIDGLDKIYIDGLDKKTQLCNHKTKKKYLPKINDPLLKGPYRAIIKKCFSPSILNETAVKNWIDGILINKIHRILRNDYNYHEFEQKNDTLKKKKSISKEIRHELPLMSPFSGESTFNRIDLLLEEKQIGSEDQEKFLTFLVDAIIGLKINNELKKKPIGLTEIGKQVPCWSHQLRDDMDLEDNMVQADPGKYIVSAEGNRIFLYTDDLLDDDDLGSEARRLTPQEFYLLKRSSTVDFNSIPKPEPVDIIDYSEYPDYDRDLIRGSMRCQRRKTVIYRVWQYRVHSPLFLDRRHNYFVFLFKDSFKDVLRFYKSIKRFIKTNKFKFKGFNVKEYQKATKKSAIKHSQTSALAIWGEIDNAQTYRGLLLFTQSILRKQITLPLLIIAKNILLKLFFNCSEWSKDFNELKKEIHVRCTFWGSPISETDFPEDWLEEGFQIKMIFPFYLRPWSRSLQTSYTKKTKEQKDQDQEGYLTVLGLETEVPMGPPKKRPPFFRPLFVEITKKIQEELNKKIQEFAKSQSFLVFNNLLNGINELVIQSLLRVFIRVFRRLIELIEPVEIKKEKSSAINNNIVHESSIQDGFMNQTSDSDLVSEAKQKYLANRIRTIKTKIENFAKEKNQIFKTLISQSNKTRYGTKNFESPQNIGQILKKKNTRLIRKSNILQKFFRERLFIDLFLYLINIKIPRMNIEFCLESTKNFIEKRLDNNEKIQERVEKKKKSQLRKPLFHFLSHMKKKSWNLSFLSQAYVFYKLSQGEVNEIKEIVGTSGRTQWKNWLKLNANYHYDLSQLKWWQLGPKKWRNRVTEYCEVENKNLQKNKRNKDKKIKNSKNYLLLNQNYKLKKNEKYNLFAYNCLWYDFHIPKNFFCKARDYYRPFIERWLSLPITNYLESYLDRKCIPDREKNPKRKYFDWKMIHFCLRKKMDVEAWINSSSRSNKKTKTEKKNPISNQEFLLFPQFLLLYNAYKMKPWVIPINSLFSISQRDSESDVQENYIEPDVNYIDPDADIENEYFEVALKRFLVSQVHWYQKALHAKLYSHIYLYSIMLRALNPKQVVIGSLENEKLDLNLLLQDEDLTLKHLRERGILGFEVLPMSVKDHGKCLFYQTIGISLKSQKKKNQKGNIFSIDKKKKNREKNRAEWMPIPETLLSPRRRRKWRILTCLNSSNNNGMMYRSATKSYRQTCNLYYKTFMPEKHPIFRYKVFLWPNYRLEDLACMNRYWFDTHNGSRFSLLRLRMYPRLK